MTRKKYTMRMRLGLLLCFAVFLGACATTADRVARETATAQAVAKALANRDYCISISSMYPQKGGVVPVSYGFSLAVKGDTLVSYLPYFGRAYSLPYGGGKGLNFTERLVSYQQQSLKKGGKRIVMSVSNEEDTYRLAVDVYDNGRATLQLQSRHRESICYDGEIVIEDGNK